MNEDLDLSLITETLQGIETGVSGLPGVESTLEALNQTIAETCGVLERIADAVASPECYAPGCVKRAVVREESSEYCSFHGTKLGLYMRYVDNLDAADPGDWRKDRIAVLERELGL